MKRFWEIDAFRGLAIIMMIFYHTLYLLLFLRMMKIDLFNGFFWVFPRCVAGLFLFLAGVSLTLSFNRVKDSMPRVAVSKKFIIRGLFILMFGLAISVVSYIALGEVNVVLFGILHLIGIAIIISIPLVSFRFANLFAGLAVLAAGIILGFYRFDFFWFLWLGLRPLRYYPVDYLPLLPWYSFILFGLFAGNFFYRENKRQFPLPDLSGNILIRFLGFLGRFSIYIYLAHIPLIYGILCGIKLLFLK